MQTDKEDKLILSRAEDACKIAEKTYSVKAFGFLNPHQRSLIMKNIVPSRDIRVSFEGGYADAERTLYVCTPEYADNDISQVIKVIKAEGRDLSSLTHRDYLGSLMGLGITRENIGDILVAENSAFIFVKSDIAEYILSNLDKIGRAGVKLSLCDCDEAALPEPKIKEIKGTVSSLRLDAILSLAAGISRARAAEMIERELVLLNWETVTSISEKVKEGDLISARGVGRMRILSIGGLTRKERTVITIGKYE